MHLARHASYQACAAQPCVHDWAPCSAAGCRCGACGAPALVAFAGSCQFKGLLNADRWGRDKVAAVAVGRQELLPEGWPLPASSQVWVLPSTSGACPLSNEAREGPWARLAQELAQQPWPRHQAACPLAGST